MSTRWPTVRLGEVLQRSDETVVLQPDVEYREITVKLWGKGVVLRGLVTGAQVAAQRRYAAHAGQFILSRIDARNGALGIVPDELDGAVVTNDFPVFCLDSERVLSPYLGWMCRTAAFVEHCRRASEGTTNRVRLQEEKFLGTEIPLPPLAEQRQVVARIEDLAAQIRKAHAFRQQEKEEVRQMLLEAFRQIATCAPRHPMREIAPQVRRPIKVNPFGSYPELGIRSFGNGTFHKPALSGVDIGDKRIFRIEPGDLLFSNVFAWEGAIAVVKRDDVGRVGSHRFITCVPRPGVTTPEFLCFFFLTQEGLELIRAASPGGAGRNRTLGLAALDAIEVPVPAFGDQKWFDALQAEVDVLKRLQAETDTELEALLPSILDRAFNGEL